MDTDLPTLDDVANMTVKQMQSVVTRLGVSARHFHGPKADLADEVREFLRRRAADEPVGNLENASYRVGVAMDGLKIAALSEAMPQVLREAVALLAPLLMRDESADFRRGVESCIEVLIEAQVEALIG